MLIASMALGGCYRDYELVDPPVRDAGPRSDASDAGWREPVGTCSEAAPIDLLFVIDNSVGMELEQERLAAALPELFALLADPPDDDRDGVPDWLPITHIQAGVVTTDMGSGGHPLPTCSGGERGPELGDDGLLRTRSNRGSSGCDDTYPAIHRFAEGDPTDFAADLGCVIGMGASGCGFEQPLEAALKALSPASPTAYTGPGYRPPQFHSLTSGHGDGANAGLVSAESLLAVVILADEDDCSVRDPQLMNPGGPYADVDLNLRCVEVPDAVHPVQRYVDGLLALRANRPDLLALAVLAGIPTDAEAASPDATDYDALLLHPDMEVRPDPDAPSRLRPSCHAPDGAAAFPPRRLVQVAAGLGPARSIVRSVCRDDYRPTMHAIAQLLGRRACKARTTR